MNGNLIEEINRLRKERKAVILAHNYTRGLAVQNGLVKVFGELGCVKEGKRTAQIQ